MSTNCVFCRIVAGRLPSYKVYEDDQFLGFLDIRPLNPGNSLLIPKKHYRWVYDVTNFGEYWEAAKRLSLAIQKTVKSESVSFLTLGYEVAHAHIRIIPRFVGDDHTAGIKLNAIKNIPPEEMARLASAIRSAL